MLLRIRCTISLSRASGTSRLSTAFSSGAPKNELAQTTEERNIVVWVNEYFGRVEADGKKFSEMAAYRDNADKVCGAVIFAKRNQDTFGRDVEDMISAKLTFQEAITTARMPIMAKQRLKVVQRDLFEQLDQLAF